jgi:hypothetical protein
MSTTDNVHSFQMEKETPEEVIEMNFGNQSKITTVPNDSNLLKAKKPVIEEDPNKLLYVFAVISGNNINLEIAHKLVETHLIKIAPSTKVSYLSKENQLLLLVKQEDSKWIKDLIQKVLDQGYYAYINDGSDVIFRPGMKYNQLNHQRIQLMNYRCYLDRNDPKIFKMKVRPIFLNKNYWITEDGKEFCKIMKDAFTRIDNKDQTKEKNRDSGKKVEYQIDHLMIRKWIDKGLVYAQYQSLKYKKQDFELQGLDKKNVNLNKIEKDLREMRHIYKYKLNEWKKILVAEDLELSHPKQ